MPRVASARGESTPRIAPSFPERNGAVAAEGLGLLIKSDHDIRYARQRARELAGQLGFSNFDRTLIATAISELARNIVLYTQGGEIIMKTVHQGGRDGIMVVARDAGPGVACVARAQQDGYSTSRGLGLGLPGMCRAMDSFHLALEINSGTMVTIKKWTAPPWNTDRWSW